MTSCSLLANRWRNFGVTGAFGLSLLLGVFCIPAVADEAGAKSDVSGKKDLRGDAQADAYQPSLMDIEYLSWNVENTCLLLEQGSPMVQVHASHMLDMRANLSEYGHPEVHCNNGISVGDTSAIRRQALKEDPFNPVLVYYVYQTDCATAEPAPWCASAQLPERLQALDPDNAVPYLLPVNSWRGTSRGSDGFAAGLSSLTELSPQEMILLAQAAAAERFDTYTTAGALEIHAGIDELMADQPSFIPSDQAAASVEAEELSLILDQDASSLMAVDIISTSIAFVGPASQRILNACKAAHENAETETMEYCQSIGRLMTAARNEIDISIGEHILGLADVEPEADLDENDMWRRFVTALIRSCEMPKGLLINLGLSGPMPDEHTTLWLEDRMEMREIDAMREAAIREYALYPDDFELDPARCRDIAELPDDIQQLLAEAYRANTQTGNDAWREAFKAAAVALDAF